MVSVCVLICALCSVRRARFVVRWLFHVARCLLVVVRCVGVRCVLRFAYCLSFPLRSLLVVRCVLFALVFGMLSFGVWCLVFGVRCCLRFVIWCVLFVVCCMSIIVWCLLPVVRCSLCVVRCLQCAARCVLFVCVPECGLLIVVWRLLL